MVHVGSQGDLVIPCRLDTPDESIPQSGMTVDPRTIPPAAPTLAATGLSTSGTTCSTAAVPDGMGTPARPMFSLRVRGMPSIGPSGRPASQRTWLASASARIRSRSERTQKALSVGSASSMTATTASATVTGESEPTAYAARSSTADSLANSLMTDKVVPAARPSPGALRSHLHDDETRP